ncbi:unnamed protein product [Gadus morhua 'NCC']
MQTTAEKGSLDQGELNDGGVVTYLDQSYQYQSYPDQSSQSFPLPSPCELGIGSCHQQLANQSNCPALRRRHDDTAGQNLLTVQHGCIPSNTGQTQVRP